MEKLEEAIKNQPDPVEGVLGYVFDGDQIEEWIKRIEVLFDAFEKANVIVPRKLWENLVDFMEGREIDIEQDFEDFGKLRDLQKELLKLGEGKEKP